MPTDIYADVTSLYTPAFTFDADLNWGETFSYEATKRKIEGIGEAADYIAAKGKTATLSGRVTATQLDPLTFKPQKEVDGTRRILGLRMVPNWPLGWFYTGRCPTGVVLVLMDFGDDEARDQCTYDGMGHRWKLCTLVDDGEPVVAEHNWTASVP